MYKKIIFFVLILFSFFTTKVQAGGFNLKSIGGVNTSGQQISHWWYTGLSPVLVGEAMSGTTVNISVDGANATATADASGDWSYNTGSLTSGDHAIVLTSGDSTISFKLTLGKENVDWDAVGSGNGETLPAAGVAWPTMILLGIGGALFLVTKRLI